MTQRWRLMLFLVAAAAYVWITVQMIALPISILLGKIPDPPASQIVRVFIDRSSLTLIAALVGLWTAAHGYRRGYFVRAFLWLGVGILGSAASFILLSRFAGVL